METQALVPREHAAVFGAGPRSLAETAVRVFDSAPDSGEALVFMAPEPDPERLAELPDRHALLAAGRLKLVATAEAYPHRDPARLLVTFDDTLRTVLAEGWTGMRVVADNTPLVRGGDGAFADWVRWEHITHRWQETSPVVGACWFDTDVVDASRRTQLAAVHGEVHGAVRPPSFRVLAAESGFRVVGDVDPHEVGAFAEALVHLPHAGELLVDLRDTGYVHHTALAAFDRLPATVQRVRVTGARATLRRVWQIVGEPSGRVRFD